MFKIIVDLTTGIQSCLSSVYHQHFSFPLQNKRIILWIVAVHQNELLSRYPQRSGHLLCETLLLSTFAFLSFSSFGGQYLNVLPVADDSSLA